MQNGDNLKSLALRVVKRWDDDEGFKCLRLNKKDPC